ncbi:MAG: T9SS type A sorting domain-containing protein [Bacteroidota bacterium]
MNVRYLYLLLITCLLSSAASAQPTLRVQPDHLLHQGGLNSLTEYVAHMRAASPSVVTAFDVDGYDAGAWLDFEDGTRTFDAAGRLSQEITCNPALFFGRCFEIRVTYAYNDAGQLTARTVDEDRNDTGVFIPTQRTSYTYDGGLVSSRTEERFRGDSFTPERRERYAYSGGQVASVTLEGYVFGEFRPISRTTYVYGAAVGIPTETIEQTYRFGNFINSTRTLLTESSGAVTATSQEWNQIAWFDEERAVYEGATLADLASALTSEFLVAADEGPGLFGAVALAYASYDPNLAGFFDRGTTERWDGSAWVPDERTTLLRTNGLVDEAVNEVWRSAWVRVSRSRFSYGASGRVTSVSQEDWDGSAWTVENVWSFTRDGVGTLAEFLAEEFTPSVSALVPTIRIQYTWADRPVSTEDEARVQAVSLDLAGANPFAERTALSFTLAAPTEATVVVHDMLGRTVATLADNAFAAGTHRIEFEAGGLPAGVYVVRLVAGASAAAPQVSVQTVTLVR